MDLRAAAFEVISSMSAAVSSLGRFRVVLKLRSFSFNFSSLPAKLSSYIRTVEPHSSRSITIGGVAGWLRGSHIAALMNNGVA